MLHIFTKTRKTKFIYSISATLITLSIVVISLSFFSEDLYPDSRLLIGLTLLVAFDLFISFRRNTKHQKALEDEILERRRYARRLTESNRSLQEKSIQLQKAKQLAEQASLAKTEFLSRMSHELRTPLNAISGYAQLLQLEEKSRSEEVQQIEQAADHLLMLINEILDLNMIESGHLTLSTYPIQLKGILKECIELIYPLAKTRNIALSTNIETLPDTYIITDRGRLKQIIINLLSNGVKYMDTNGHLQLNADLVSSHVRISITDDGPGISEEDLTKILRPFTRLRRDRDRAEGSGIGLTITQKLLEMLDSSLTIESALGKGSTFSFTLEYVPEGDDWLFDSNTATEKTVITSREDRIHILLAEDNPVNQTIAKRFLEKLNHKVTLANDGKEAVELCQQQRFDLIFMDLDMPIMSGIEAASAILSGDEPNAQTPIIALTANVMEESKESCKEVGMAGFLEKPLRFKSLTHLLDSLTS